MSNVVNLFLLPKKDYQNFLKEARDTIWITTRGASIKRLEYQLHAILKVDNTILTTIDTRFIQIAMKKLTLMGEVRTISFNYVATTSSIIWKGCKLKFVGFNCNYLTNDETKY